MTHFNLCQMIDDCKKDIALAAGRLDKISFEVMKSAPSASTDTDTIQEAWNIVCSHLPTYKEPPLNGAFDTIRAVLAEAAKRESVDAGVNVKQLQAAIALAREYQQECSKNNYMHNMLCAFIEWIEQRAAV